MFLIALLAAAVFIAPLGAFMAWRARHRTLTVALAGATVFFHTLAWTWIVSVIKEPGNLLLVSLIGLLVEVMIIAVASDIAEELR